jgi:hypothetical protein
VLAGTTSRSAVLDANSLRTAWPLNKTLPLASSHTTLISPRRGPPWVANSSASPLPNFREYSGARAQCKEPFKMIRSSQTRRSICLNEIGNLPVTGSSATPHKGPMNREWNCGASAPSVLASTVVKLTARAGIAAYRLVMICFKSA